MAFQPGIAEAAIAAVVDQKGEDLNAPVEARMTGDLDVVDVDQFNRLAVASVFDVSGEVRHGPEHARLGDGVQTFGEGEGGEIGHTDAPGKGVFRFGRDVGEAVGTQQGGGLDPGAGGHQQRPMGSRPRTPFARTAATQVRAPFSASAAVEPTAPTLCPLVRGT